MRGGRIVARQNKAEKESLDILVVDGVEGPSVYLNDYRIAGPKPWGGGKVLFRFSTTVHDLERALKAKITPDPNEEPSEEATR